MDGLVAIKARDGWIARQERHVGGSLPREEANDHIQRADQPKPCVRQQRTARKDQREFLGKNNKKENRLGGQEFTEGE